MNLRVAWTWRALITPICGGGGEVSAPWKFLYKRLFKRLQVQKSTAMSRQLDNGML